MQHAIETLEPVNAAAWLFYKSLSTRFLVDAGLVPEMFRCKTAGLDLERVEDLIERLSLMYDVMTPRKT